MSLEKRKLGREITIKFFDANKDAELAYLRENAKADDVILDSIMNPNIEDRYYTEDDLVWAKEMKPIFRALNIQIEEFLKNAGI